jgi:hypothetical protein
VTPHTSARTLRDESIAQIAGKIRALERGEPLPAWLTPCGATEGTAAPTEPEETEMNIPSRVKLVDVGPRDGLQNEKQPVPRPSRSSSCTGCRRPA